MTQNALQWIGIGVSATLAILSLGWNVFKHFSDRAEKRREQLEERKEVVAKRKLEVTTTMAGTSGVLRLANDGRRPVSIESVQLCWGDKVDDVTTLSPEALPNGFTAIPLQPKAGSTGLIAPGETRDYLLKIGHIFPDLEPCLASKRVWIDVDSNNGRVLRLLAEEIDWVVRSLIDVVKEKAQQ